MMHFNPAEYEAFRYVKEEDMETLMVCAAARMLPFPAGSRIAETPEMGETCALVLKGSVTAYFEGGKSMTIEKGGVLGARLFAEAGRGPENPRQLERAEAGEGCVLLVMSHSGATVPCWWSCSFHAAFSENLTAIAARQLVELKGGTL